MNVLQIREDMKNAMRAKDALRVETLRGALAAFTNELVAKGKKPTDELTEAEVVGVMKRLAKQRKDSIDQYTSGGRPELAEKEKQELAIIEEYLPQMASLEKIEKVAIAKKAELGITDAQGLGKLTGAVMKEMNGLADGNDVKAVVAKLLKA
jgi:uncharacterized protein YqeY